MLGSTLTSLLREQSACLMRLGHAHCCIYDHEPGIFSAVGGLGAAAGLQWVVGDAEQLPLAARSVDGYTIAFGIRNVTRIDAALAEAFRVRLTWAVRVSVCFSVTLWAHTDLGATHGPGVSKQGSG